MNNDEYLEYLNNQFEESVNENIRWEKLYNELSEENEALKEINEKLRKTLRFYADSINWEGEYIIDDAAWDEDAEGEIGGKRASHCLLKLYGPKSSK